MLNIFVCPPLCTCIIISVQSSWEVSEATWWTGLTAALERPESDLFARSVPPLGFYWRGHTQGDAGRRPEGEIESPDRELWLSTPDNGGGERRPRSWALSVLSAWCISSWCLLRRQQKYFKLSMSLGSNHTSTTKKLSAVGPVT